MQNALPKLQRRLDQVNAIDPTQATRTYAPEFASINDNVNATFIEIFGEDSLDYDRYKSSSIYAGPLRYSRDMPRHEVIRGYEEGKKRVLIKLDAAIKFVGKYCTSIAVTLRDRFPTIAETEPAVIAHHFTQRGQTEEAIEWWGKAGDQARRRFAFAEAIAHLGKAIDLAIGLPDEPERRLARLRLQIAYANAHLHARGPGAIEPTTAFAQAREIAAGVRDAPERFSAYYGLWVSHWVRGELAAAREAAEAAFEDIKSLPERWSLLRRPGRLSLSIPSPR
jgi:hypothetical protein